MSGDGTGGEIIHLVDRDCGLEAVIVLDSNVLGPAAGGVRTQRYSSFLAAQNDAEALASAMTAKCALGGLDAGGGKCVVLDHDKLDRPRAFAALGRAIQRLEGRFRTAGDLGTTIADLEAMATHCQYVHTDERRLAESVARGHHACLLAVLGIKTLSGVSVAIQGCGAIGSAIARRLASAGATLVVADIDGSRADALVTELGATRCSADKILTADVDVLAPCASGGVIGKDLANRLRARLVCGGANNILADGAAERELYEAGVEWVPDVISSAGAVIDGIGLSVMGLADRGPLIDALGETAANVARRSVDEARLPSEIVWSLVESRIESRRATSPDASS